MSRLHGMLKKETVNLSLKNAILCLDFKRGLHYISTDHHFLFFRIHAESLFFEYSNGDIES